MKKIIIAIGILVLVGIIGFYLLGNSKSTGEVFDIDKEQSNQQKQNGQYIVEITSTGFNPKVLTINTGDSVIWINKYGSPSWPASNVHPTHTVYPGSNINKCGNAEQGNIFDACRNLKSGESYSFIFNEKGDWGYHDHLDPGLGGTIIVK